MLSKHVTLPPSDLGATLANLPRRVDRRTGAELVTRHFFPVSHRTLEAAPLTWRRINGYALVDTAELFEWAQAKVDAAPRIRGGRMQAAPAEAVAA